MTGVIVAFAIGFVLGGAVVWLFFPPLD